MCRNGLQSDEESDVMENENYLETERQAYLSDDDECLYFYFFISIIIIMHHMPSLGHWRVPFYKRTIVYLTDQPVCSLGNFPSSHIT